MAKPEIVTMPLDQLTPAPYNPRKISKQALSGLTASVKRFGLVQPIVWNKRTGFVVGGHQRIEALKNSGETEAQVIVVDLSDEDERSLNVTLNNAHVEGEFTDDLYHILESLRSSNPVIFTELNLDTLMDGLYRENAKPGQTDPDFIPAPPLAATVKPGDIWKLGNHRLMCGDSANSADVKKLLDGAPIHLVNTDPPYNVKVEPRSNNAIAAGNSSFTNTHHQNLDRSMHPNKNQATHKVLRAKDRPLMNDFVKPGEFDVMLRSWFGNMAAALVPGRAFYIWGGYANCTNYPKALDECGLYFSQTIIWVKKHPVLTRKDFMGNHEWCFFGFREDADNLVLAPSGFTRDHKYAFYGWKEGAAHYFNAAIMNATDVWEVKKINPQSMVHLTEKPVELATRAIQYSSRPAENVLDLFGGSGSTLIACEQTERHAYLMELDPLYADVIIERWEKFTGEKAEKL